MQRPGGMTAPVIVNTDDAHFSWVSCVAALDYYVSPQCASVADYNGCFCPCFKDKILGAGLSWGARSVTRKFFMALCTHTCEHSSSMFTHWVTRSLICACHVALLHVLHSVGCSFF